VRQLHLRQAGHRAQTTLDHCRRSVINMTRRAGLTNDLMGWACEYRGSPDACETIVMWAMTIRLPGFCALPAW
jgi:hypothetical protein